MLPFPVDDLAPALGPQHVGMLAAKDLEIITNAISILYDSLLVHAEVCRHLPAAQAVRAQHAAMAYTLYALSHQQVRQA